MKMKWREFGGEWRAVIGRGVVASIERVGSNYYWLVLGGVVSKTDTIEAAKQAAEEAVLKWFREALGEPVAQFSHIDGVIPSGNAAWDALHDKTAYGKVAPLYALPSKEEGDE